MALARNVYNTRYAVKCLPDNYKNEFKNIFYNLPLPNIIIEYKKHIGPFSIKKMVENILDQETLRLWNEMECAVSNRMSYALYKQINSSKIPYKKLMAKKAIFGFAYVKGRYFQCQETSLFHLLTSCTMTKKLRNNLDESLQQYLLATIEVKQFRSICKDDLDNLIDYLFNFMQHIFKIIKSRT